MSFLVSQRFHAQSFRCNMCILVRRRRLEQKMGAVLSRLAATDGNSFTFFESHSHSSNPLSEICLLVPFPPPSSQGFSEWTVPATSLGPMTLAGRWF